MATRPPGWMPLALSAGAARVTSSPRPRWVSRRLPQTTAFLSGKTRADRTRKDGGVSRVLETRLISVLREDMNMVLDTVGVELSTIGRRGEPSSCEVE